MAVEIDCIYTKKSSLNFLVAYIVAIFSSFVKLDEPICLINQKRIRAYRTLYPRL